MEEQKLKTQTCTNCKRELDVGVEATKVNSGVIGMRGFVPLGDSQYFCCDNCVKDYFDLSDLQSMPPRLP